MTLYPDWHPLYPHKQYYEFYLHECGIDPFVVSTGCSHRFDPHGRDIESFVMSTCCSGNCVQVSTRCSCCRLICIQKNCIVESLVIEK